MLKAIVGAELFDEEWHPVSAKYTVSTENVAVRATITARPAVPRGYLLVSMSDPRLSALMILSLGTLNKPQWRLLWGTLKGYFLIAPRPRSAYPTQSKPLKIILDIRYQHAIMHAITIRFYPAQRTMLARQAVLLTPSNFSGSTPLLSCQPAFARKPFVSSLFHTLLESAHPHDSTAFSIPLFSYTYALFCTQQKLNSFIFMRFRALCAKHPGWGVPYSHGGGT